MRARTWMGLSALLIASSAAAQGEGPASRAEKLFREGVTAAEQNDYVTACAKFKQSLDLVERASTLLNLGTCEAEQGRLATAYRYYKKGIGMLQPGDERLATTTKLMDELSARVPRVRIQLSEATPANARVVIDDAEVPRDALDSVMLDPGKHRIVLSAPEHEDATATVELAEKDHKTIELAPGPSTKATEGPVPQPKPDPVTNEEGPELAIPGYIIGAIGVGAAVAAAVTGGLIIANDGTIDERCPNLRCDAEGADLVETNKTLLIVNAVTFGVAAAGIATGAALLIADAVLDGGSKESAAMIQPVVSPTGVFVGVTSRF
ncbi:MAG TPA: PEGA domain-containing protein [Polyangiaceae bacterium]|nr:PEGA domain-containing protein [Polyangiaceae bacterium]